ncbi:hypothetical protein [Nocardia seriolae]|uniref:Uncharacterized protein n=1 Tax=Nocardia seriolae TaxID=37332 RepID=A0A0B8NQN6_9NOCA|nr:hypothetical protein [Nocardia seriolae]APA97077.1 hypothetical protein NS506_03020 [Nocardia seriolae]MTJ65124.1 hypothetical protein [Nocardia seriolae]MTJ71222.1 hypothetical protein [Nocardia seriolae]MTJ86952.1 hypothetical protein [Nocardia seriolae]MTK30947.1 hypothetical protein [Nocardia seriolae]
MNTNNHGKGIDWDGELQMLMESSGIKLAELIRPQWKTRLRRRILGARAVGAAVAVTVPLMWVSAASGAPEAAVIPVLVWLAGWIGYGVWISLGRPDWSVTAHTARDLGTAAFHATSRFYFAHTRPLRARWRAWRAARNRDRTEAASVPTIA